MVIVGMRWLLGTAAVMAAASGAAKTIEIRPGGDSLAAAIIELRAVPKTEARRIVIHDGTYRLPAPLTLTAADSGTAEQPLVIMAAPGAKPVLSGGIRLPPMMVKDGIWRLRVPTTVTSSQLYVNGLLAQPARTPNAGTTWQMTAVEEVELKESNAHFQAGFYQFVEFGEDAAKALPLETRGLWLQAYHKWDMTRRRLLETEEERVLIGPGKMKSWNPLREGTRFFLEGHADFVDTAGEWHLADGELRYLPRAGERNAEATVVAPRLERLVKLEGLPGAPVAHVEFRGLTFAHTNYAWREDGFSPAQAANPVGAAIEVDFGTAVVFEDCEVREVGGYGLWLRDGCRNCEVRSCRFEELGGGGIRIGQTSGRPQGVKISRSNRIADTTIRGGGKVLPPAVGILVGHASDNLIEHNEIADLNYSAISLGWRWGYDDSVAKGNKVLNNHLHHIGGMLSDQGAVYTLGPSEGTVVAGNVIHDVGSFSYGGWGLYCDEGSTGIVMENNLVYRTKTGGFHQHYGRDNVVRNNLFYDAAEHQLQLTRAEEHRSFTFERNLVIYRRGKLMHGRWAKAQVAMDQNLYWHEGSEEIVFPTGDFASWQAAGRGVNSVIADPKLRSPQTGDFGLAADSPALGIGFKPVDWGRAGPRSTK